MLSNKIADVWLPGGRSFAMRTIPGQVLKFVGGHAEITHHHDMPHVLRLADARIEISREYVDWLPNWLASCQPPFSPKVQASYWVKGDLDGCDGIAGRAVPSTEPVARETMVLSDEFPPDIAMAAPGRHPAGHQCKLCHNYRVGLMKKRVREVAI